MMSREQRLKKKIGCTVSQRANLDLIGKIGFAIHLQWAAAAVLVTVATVIVTD
jgi:hypothetical protein